MGMDVAHAEDKTSWFYICNMSQWLVWLVYVKMDRTEPGLETELVYVVTKHVCGAKQRRELTADWAPHTASPQGKGGKCGARIFLNVFEKKLENEWNIFYKNYVRGINTKIVETIA